MIEERPCCSAVYCWVSNWMGEKNRFRYKKKATR